MVDVSKIRTDWENVSEADWQVNSARAQANRLTAEPLNALGLAVIEALSQSGTGGGGGLDVEAAVLAIGVVNGNGATQAQIDAWRAIRPDVIILGTEAVGDTPVTAVAPTFTDDVGTANDTYTIPTVTGVEYQISGGTVAAGTYPVGAGATVTITAVGADGFYIVGDDSWTHTFSTVAEPTEVTPTAPTMDDAADTYTIPASTGVDYQIGGSTVSAGTYSVGDVDTTVNITASAQAGYALTGTTSWVFEFTKVPTAASVSDDFNRATASTLGPNWTDPSSMFGIASDGLTATTRVNPSPASAKALYTGGTEGGVFSDVKVEAVIIPVAVDALAGVLARADASGIDTFYMGRKGPTDTAQIYRFVAGTATLITSVGFTFSGSGNLIALEVYEDTGGTQLRLLVDGVERATALDSDVSRPMTGVTGIRTNTHVTKFDDFAATAI